MKQLLLPHAHFAAVVQSSGDAIVSTDIEDRIKSWNPGAVALFGFTEEEALGRTIEELIVPPHMIEQRRKLYEDVRAGRVASRSWSKASDAAKTAPCSR